MQHSGDPFYAEATKILGIGKHNTEDNSSQVLPSRQTIYFSFCILHIDNPSKICSYLGSFNKEQPYNIKLFLKALYSVSLVYIGDPEKCRLITKTYKILLETDKIAKYILQNCEIPILIRKKLKLDESSDSISNHQLSDQRLQPKDLTLVNVDTSPLTDCKAVTRLIILFSQMESPSTLDDVQIIWKQALSVIGQYKASATKLMEIILSTIVKEKKYRSARFIFEQLSNLIGIQNIMKHLLLKQLMFPPTFNRVQAKQNESMPQLFDEYNANGLMLDTNIVAFAVLAKYSLASQKQIFSSILPTLDDLLYQINEKCEQYQTLLSMTGLTETTNSFFMRQGTMFRKQEFLTQLILMNALQPFRKIMDECKINSAMLDYPPLFFAFSQLLQWSIDPLFQAISFSRHFPKSNKRSSKYKIPEGSLIQYTVVNLSFTEKVWDLLNLSSGFVFARRSTFVKFCRLLLTICKAQKSITIVKEDGPKIFAFISKCLIKYLIPSIQFYNKDYSVVNALNQTLQSFNFKYQQQLILQTIINRSTQPVQLLINTVWACQKQSTFMNRIADFNKHLIQKMMKELVEDRPFSVLHELFKRLTVKGTITLSSYIISIVVNSHMLIKKTLITFIFLSLVQGQKYLVNKDSSFTAKFEILIQFINEYLVSQRYNKEFVKLLISYLINKLQPTDKETIEVSNLQFFSAHIPFFFQIVKFILPIQKQRFDTSNEAQQVKFVNGGTCMKVLLQQRIDCYFKSKNTRKVLSQCLLDPMNPFQSKLFIILVRIYQHQTKVLVSRAYNISHMNYLFDHISNLVNYLIELVHFQTTSSSKIQCFFSFKHLDRLLNQYHVPLKICFTLLRKGVLDKYPFKNEQFFGQNDWKAIKDIYHEAIDKYLSNTTSQSSLQLQNWQVFCYCTAQKQYLLKSDVFLVFWLLPYESSIRKKHKYQRYIGSLQDQIKSLNDRKKIENRKLFIAELKQQQKWTLSLPQINKILKSPELNQTFKFQKPQQQQQYFRLFIKNCIIPRALISKSDTHYAWSFLINLLQRYQATAKRFFKVICILRQQICEFLVFQTQREATQLLPLLANSPNYFTECWYKQKLFEQRLSQYSFLPIYFQKRQYDSVIRTLKASSKKLVASLVRQSCKETLCTAKNILQFICQAQFIPMLKEQIIVVNNFLDELSKKYQNCSAIAVKLERAKKIVLDRSRQVLQSGYEQVPQNLGEKGSEASASVHSSKGTVEEQEEKATTQSNTSKNHKQSPIHSINPDANLKQISKQSNGDLPNIHFQKVQKVQESAQPSTKSPIKKESVSKERSVSKGKKKELVESEMKEVICLQSSEEKIAAKQPATLPL